MVPIGDIVVNEVFRQVLECPKRTSSLTFAEKTRNVSI